MTQNLTNALNSLADELKRHRRPSPNWDNGNYGNSDPYYDASSDDYHEDHDHCDADHDHCDDDHDHCDDNDHDGDCDADYDSDCGDCGCDSGDY